MSRYHGFPEYVSVAKKKKNSEKALAKLKKSGHSLSPVIIDGTKIAKSWWGIEWIKNLERYADYENRIGRGRSYVRHGAVIDLRIEKGEIKALVQGSKSRPYTIKITIAPLKKKSWRDIIEMCEGKIDSIGELLAGKFPKELSELFTAKGKGLFPSPKEILFDCSCPDWASMCKHVAAVLYGVGARLDSAPSVFFTLRGADVDELIVKTVAVETKRMTDKAASKSRRIMSGADLSATFGIELAPAPVETSKKKSPSAKAPRGAAKSAAKKSTSPAPRRAAAKTKPGAGKGGSTNKKSTVSKETKNIAAIKKAGKASLLKKPGSK